MFAAVFLAAIAAVAYGQTPQHCSYKPDGFTTVDNKYTWSANSWPGDDQNFTRVATVGGGIYLGEADFLAGGQFAGQNWKTVFYTNKDQYRPLGFRYAFLGAYNVPTVCLYAKDTAGYKVELMVYALTPEASLCVRDMNADAYATQDTGTVAVCDRGEVYACFASDTFESDLDVAIYCDTDCEDGQEVELLWRFRRSTLTWDANQASTTTQTDMWCAMIAGSKVWPSALTADVPVVVPAGGENEPRAGAASLGAVAALAAASLLVFLH